VLILLPPSEGKAAPARGKPLDLDAMTMPELREARAEVLDALVTLCRPGSPDLPLESASARHLATQTLGLGKTQSDEIDRNAALRTAPTARAEQIYTGVLYEALDLPSLETAAKRRASTWVAITSGLFGLVRPHDRIPAYRLSGDVSLPGLGPVAAHWRGVLEPAVLEAAGGGLILDLRSTTYAGFWRPHAGVGGQVASVRVLHEVGGERKVVSHFNKATKGRLVRSLLTSGDHPASPAELVEALGDHGWHVEVERAGRTGTKLDVVVSDL